MTQPHDERIAQLRRDFEDGVVEPNIYFSSKSARFRVKFSGRWIGGVFWTIQGARRAKTQVLISKEQKKLARQEQAVEDTKQRINKLTRKL